LDEETAQTLERVEALLARAKGAVSEDPDKARRLLAQAHGLAQGAVEGGAQITLPSTLAGLRRHRPHPRGYWTGHGA